MLQMHLQIVPRPVAQPGGNHSAFPSLSLANGAVNPSVLSLPSSWQPVWIAGVTQRVETQRGRRAGGVTCACSLDR